MACTEILMATRENHPNWIAELFPPQGAWTEDDYFALPETNRIIELSEGKVIRMPPPSPAHQLVINRLNYRLTDLVKGLQLGEVFPSPIAVRLWESKIRGPDILFVRAEHLDRVGDKAINGAPDWVAEVISPRSRKLDTVEKLADYARAGVPEYWVLDPKNRQIYVYLLRGRSYELIATYHPGEAARSETIAGFAVSLDEVFGS
jgi:Uma2 family endonuclease